MSPSVGASRSFLLFQEPTDLLMRKPLVAIERSHGFLNAGDLPLVQVEVLLYLARGPFHLFTLPSF